MQVQDVHQRYGLDYPSYLQQASAVYQGQRNYTLLSSSQGPCFYAAGHLYHYLICFWLHEKFENAETIMQYVHVLLHCLVIFVTVKVAYIYFAEERKNKDPKSGRSKGGEVSSTHDENYSSKGQMIAFIMVGSRYDRGVWLQ